MSEDRHEQTEKILKALERITTQLQVVEQHPSQNGGWKSLMGAIEDIQGKLDVLAESINNPESGVRANVSELQGWRDRVDPILDDNRKQDERLLKLELQVGLYNKITWMIGAGVLGLLVKAFAGLVISP